MANRTCVICGETYNSCKNCDKVTTYGGSNWRNSCDRVECFQILLVINDFYYDKISKEEAREMLDGLLDGNDLSYTSNAQSVIDKIYEDDIIEAPIAQAEEIVSDPETENASVSETNEIYSDDFEQESNDDEIIPDVNYSVTDSLNIIDVEPATEISADKTSSDTTCENQPVEECEDYK